MKENESIAVLASTLTSGDDQTFENALNEVVALTKLRNHIGHKAVTSAIASLSGASNFRSYRPGLTMSLDSQCEQSEIHDELLILAKRKALLVNVYDSQKKISAFKFLSSNQDFAEITKEVYKIGGSSQAKALLLLNMEMWSAIQLAHTETVTREQHSTPKETIFAAAGHGQADVVRLFLRESQAEVDKRNRDGRTSLQLAASGGHLEVVRVLVEAGANVNLADCHGNTALGDAVLTLANQHANVPDAQMRVWIEEQNNNPKGLVRTVEYLIDHGADVNFAPRGHYRPSEWLRQIGIPRLISRLAGREKPISMWSRLFGA